MRSLNERFAKFRNARFKIEPQKVPLCGNAYAKVLCHRKNANYNGRLVCSWTWLEASFFTPTHPSTSIIMDSTKICLALLSLELGSISHFHLSRLYMRLPHRDQPTGMSWRSIHPFPRSSTQLCFLWLQPPEPLLITHPSLWFGNITSLYVNFIHS